MSVTAMDAAALVLPEAHTPREAHALEAFLGRGPEIGSLKAEIGSLRLVNAAGESMEVPGQLVEVLAAAAGMFAHGEGVAIAAIERELSTTEAARLLGMSRPSLVRLLDTDQIPSRKVGTHRRVQLRHLLAYRRQRLVQQRQAYEDLMVEADALGLDE